MLCNGRDIDLEKRILTVRKTMQRIQTPDSEAKTKLIIAEPKSESSKRKISIPDCVVSILEKFRGKAKEYLVSGEERPVEPRTMQYRFASILKNVKLPSVHFHALRHMFASKCVKLGFDIKTLSEILGHSKVEITIPVPNSNTKPVAVPTDIYTENNKQCVLAILVRTLFSSVKTEKKVDLMID